MRIARITQDGDETYGVVSGGRIATRDDIACHTGVPVPYSVKDFMFDGWYDEVKDKMEGMQYGTDMSTCRLLPPIPNPSKIICLAFNYTDHASEQGLDAPKDPVLVIKPRTALTGTDADITCPKYVTQLDYEVELAVIIGRDCKNVQADNAYDVIFGYMVFNDVSARDIQMQDKQFTRAKGFDTFAPCGPWLTTSDEVDDPQNLRLTTKVNGSVRQDSSTGKMAIRIPEIISKISSGMTLERGDIISTGTPAGVMLNKPGGTFLKDGDVVEAEIEGLGAIRNTVRFA